MSSARGRGARGRGSGPAQRGASRGSSATRGGLLRGNAQRDNTAPRGGTFGQASRGNATKAPRGALAAPKINGFNPQQNGAGAFGGMQSQGKWGDRYDALTNARERERAQAIRQGLIADPDKPRSLAEAITPVGTCQDMCAEFERVQRYVQNDVWREELDQNRVVDSSGKPEPDESRMVKKFRRAAAGLEEQLPSDLRPPPVLKRTCDYLFNEVIGNAPALEKVHHFVWDRTRAVRNDFSIQQLTKPEDLRIAIDCYERIARFHILSLHQLAVHPRPYDKYDAQQEREQLDRTLLSLVQYYDDSRSRVELQNEAEFRAYCVMFQLQDPVPDMEDRAQSWPRHIVMDRRVRAALDVYAAACNIADAQGPLKPRANHLIAQQDSAHFWTLVESKQVSYLMACVAEIYFNLVRRTTLNVLFKGFRLSRNRSTTDWTVDALRDLFMFDNEDQVYTFCQAYGFSFAEREDDRLEYLNLISVELGDLPQPNAELPKQWKSSLVEEKRFGRTLPCIVNGMTVKQAQQAGLVDEEHEMEMEDADGMTEQSGPVRRGPFLEENSDPTTEDEQSLFMPESRKPSEQRDGGSKVSLLPNRVASAMNEQAPALGGSSVPRFGLPSTGVFGQPSSAVNGPASEPGKAKATEGPSKRLFDFGAVSNPPPPATPVLSSAAKTTGTTFEPPEFNSGTAFTFPRSSKDTGTSSAADDSVFAKPPPIGESPGLFNFPKQEEGAPSSTTSGSSTEENEAPSRAPPYKAPFLESAPTSPKKPVGFNVQLNAAGATTSPPSHVMQPETKPPQPQFITSTNATPQPISPVKTAAPTISLERRNSIKKDFRPQQPSPLAKTTSLEDATSETATDILSRLAQEIFNAGVLGFLEQYVEYTVQQAITKAQEQVRDEVLSARADNFRHEVLLHRYGKKWREKLWRNRSAAKANQRRQRARRGLEEARSRGTSIVNGSRASTAELERHHREMVDSMFQQTARNGGRPAVSFSEQQAAPGSKRPLSSQATGGTASREPNHKRQKSTSHVDERGRVAKPITASDPKADLLKRSSFLGFSPSSETLHQRSTTHTNYFRMKAMGLDPNADTTEARGTKRRRSESVEPASQDQHRLSTTSSLIGKSQRQPKPATSMPPPTSAPKKDDGDEALFARLKAARETLAESTSLLKAGVAKEEALRRSLSASQSSNESPSMARARAEARWRASQKGSTFGTPEPQHEGPAYRFRESRFVPREHYSKAIERSKETRESRSRETSRPDSRFDMSVDGSFAPAFNQDSQQAQQVLSVQEARSQPSKPPNGSPFTSLPKWEPPSAKAESNAFSSIPPQATWSFVNGNSQPSHVQPFSAFGQPVASKTTEDFSSQPAFDGANGDTWRSDAQNFTVQPSQVEQSLSNTFGQSQGFGKSTSFGQSQGFGQPATWAADEHSLTPPQPDVHDHTQLASEAISLLSDDEEVDDQPAYTSQFAQAPIVNGTARERGDEELFDEADDVEVPDSYQYTNQYASNPYAALADQYGGDTEEDVDAERDYESAEGSYEDDEGQEAQAPNGYHNQNDYEGEEDGDGDVEDADEYDEEEEEDDENGGEDGMVPAQQRLPDGYEEPFDGFDEKGSEDDWTVDPGLGGWRKEPSVNPALQVVGDTAEEAIELSD